MLWAIQLKTGSLVTRSSFDSAQSCSSWFYWFVSSRLTLMGWSNIVSTYRWVWLQLSIKKLHLMKSKFFENHRFAQDRKQNMSKLNCGWIRFTKNPIQDAVIRGINAFWLTFYQLSPVVEMTFFYKIRLNWEQMESCLCYWHFGSWIPFKTATLQCN